MFVYVKKLPVCSVCAKTGFLCESCQGRLDAGEVNEFEVEISKEFLRLEESHPDMKDASFHGVIDYDNVVFFLVGPGDGQRIPPDAVEELKQVFNLDVLQLVEISKSTNRLVATLIAPAKLLGVNQIYLPMGTRELKVRVSKGDESLLPLPLPDMEDVARELLGEDVSFSFE
ncbi:MAG: hypothetical protein Kow0069_22140 [Promethearchaeota archaeon]